MYFYLRDGQPSFSHAFEFPNFFPSYPRSSVRIPPKMRANLVYLLSFVALTFGFAFGIPGSSSTPTPSAYDPCSTDSGGQKYPDRVRRSLPALSPENLIPRQFVGEQVIPGQGASAPKPPPPSAKYVISQALISQASQVVNFTQQSLPERIVIEVANVSDRSVPVECAINWNAAMAGQASVSYQLTCDNYAFCALLQQAAPAPEKGFYLYISLP